MDDGEGSTSNSYPGNFHGDQRFNTHNLGLDHHNLVPSDHTSIHLEQNVIPIHAPARSGDLGILGVEERHCESMSPTNPCNLNMNTSNAAIESNNNNNSNASQDRATGSILEENDRILGSCKRRPPNEDQAPTQLLVGESSTSADDQRITGPNFQPQAVPAQSASDADDDFSQEQSFQRNVRSRSTATTNPQGVFAAESEMQGSFGPSPSGASAAAREMESSVRGGSILSLSLRWPTEDIIQSGDYLERMPPGFRTVADSQTLLRLLSRLRSTIANMHAAENSEDEDPEIHEDMRLDVDNMSYEQLLAMGDHIGTRWTALSKEVIVAHLGQQKYQSITTGAPLNDERCCICQDEYIDGEDIGKLDCRHEFHFDCIKQWLLLNNSCPICKRTALALKEPPGKLKGKAHMS